MQEGDGRIVPMRLQRFLARAGVASRRGSENLMTAGRVRVNGQVVTELGTKVDPAVDEVEVDGILVHLGDMHTTLMLNKPAGYVTTMDDPHGRPCVAELVPARDHPGLFPIGRLDMDTTGLLLFTTDGDLAHALLHPSHHVDKHYVATVASKPSDASLEALRGGVELDDGPTQPAHVELLGEGPEGVRVGIGIHEGRKRQVRRMLEAVGHPVLALHRDVFGPIRLGSLAVGSWRMLDSGEVQALDAH